MGVEKFRCRLQRLLRCGDYAVICLRENHIARFRCFAKFAARATLQCLHHGGSRGAVIAREYFQRVGVGCRIGGAGSRGDVCRIIAGHIRDHECADGSGADRRQAAALDCRKMVADGVDVLNRGAALQQCLRDGFQISHCD